MQLQNLLMAATACALAACGGGGSEMTTTPAQTTQPPASNPSWKLSALVAKGAPLANARVTARCSNGKEVTGTTDSNGTVAITVGQFELDPAPCLLSATGGTPEVTLRSYAAKSGQVNINPLTDLVYAKAFGAGEDDLFARWGKDLFSLTDAQRQALNNEGPAIQRMMEQVSGGRANRYSDGSFPDPFSGEFAIGDDRDKLFDAFGGSLIASRMTYPEMRRLVLANSSLSTSFASAIYDALAEKIIPKVQNATCATSKDLRGVTCTVTGTNLSRPRFNALLVNEIWSDLGISVSLVAGRKPKTDPKWPYQPDWCSMSGMAPGRGRFKSTDSADPRGPDPLGVYAEELTIDCNSTRGPLTGAFVVEIVVSPSNEVIYESGLFGLSEAPGTPEKPTFPPTGGKVSIGSVSCEGNKIRTEGSADLAPNSILEIWLTRTRQTSGEAAIQSVFLSGEITCPYTRLIDACFAPATGGISTVAFSHAASDIMIGPGTYYVNATITGVKSYLPPEVAIIDWRDASVTCR